MGEVVADYGEPSCLKRRDRLLFTNQYCSSTSEWCHIVKVTLALEDETNATVRRALNAIPEVKATPGRPSRVSVGGMERRLLILPRPQGGLSESEAARLLAEKVPNDTVGLVVASMIPYRERDALELAGLSWLDGRGACHLAWPGVIVHIDRASRRRSSIEPERTDKLGPASIRAVQVVLGDPDSEWTVSVLAQRAGISTGQAHRVFAALEHSRLLDVRGSGPKQRRKITDLNGALDWLSSVDRARRKPESAATHLYGRSIRDVVNRFDDRARSVGLRYAVTGPAATEILGIPVMTSITVAHIRVSVASIDEALQRLDLANLSRDEGGHGSNVELWVDSGEVGTFESSEISNVVVAPLIRVWLDLARIGGRGEDAAHVFRERVLERP